MVRSRLLYKARFTLNDMFYGGNSALFVCKNNVKTLLNFFYSKRWRLSILFYGGEDKVCQMHSAFSPLTWTLNLNARWIRENCVMFKWVPKIKLDVQMVHTCIHKPVWPAKGRNWRWTIFQQSSYIWRSCVESLLDYFHKTQNSGRTSFLCWWDYVINYYRAKYSKGK